MKANIAVATVSGKAYYLIVNELKEKNIPFLSLTPDQPIPIEIKVVITTEEEQHLINHEKILMYHDGVEPEALINEALQIVQGKESYEKIVIGVDPGEVFGLAVLADGKVIETENCFSVKGTLDKITSVLKNVGKTPITSVSVKVGDGVPAYKEKLLRILDDALPSNVMLESVSEAGTNRYLSKTKHRRGLRDIVSAIRIAGRNGHPFPRRKTHESNG
jgi:predicted RNase H-like nuclease (RuvC/YqgF family)